MLKSFPINFLNDENCGIAEKSKENSYFQN